MSDGDQCDECGTAFDEASINGGRCTTCGTMVCAIFPDQETDEDVPDNVPDAPTVCCVCGADCTGHVCCDSGYTILGSRAVHEMPRCVKCCHGSYTSRTAPPLRGNFKIEIEVHDNDVGDLLASGFYSGCGYWCRIMDYERPETVSDTFGLDLALPLVGGAVICRIDDDTTEETDAKYTPLRLDRAALQRGLQLMANKHPQHWADFANDNADAATGDVFIQLCLLGELRYG